MIMRAIVTRELNDGSSLTVEVVGNKYFAKVSSDTRNLGFEDDHGVLEGDETAEKLADRFAMWMNDNLT